MTEQRKNEYIVSALILSLVAAMLRLRQSEKMVIKLLMQMVAQLM